MKHQNTQKVNAFASKKSECNIKTLNTIDTINTKNYKTKNYDTSIVFLADEDKTTPLEVTSSSGQEERGGISPQVALPPEITYLSVSLKSPKTERRTLNVDFKTQTTPGNTFNKLVFNLSNRYREFFANIPEQWHDDMEYADAWEHYHGSQHKEKWIGKGRPRGRFVEGKHINQKIKSGVTAVLEHTREGYVANIWIDGVHTEVLLSPVENKNYPYRYDSKSTLETVEYLPRGGWL